MKRIRFSRRILIVLVSILAFTGWWITWPERTIKQFTQLLREDKFDEVSRLMATKEDREFIEFMRELHEIETSLGERPKAQNEPDPELEREERSWSDLLRGRAIFYRMDAGFYVQRGRVSLESFDSKP